MDEPGARLELKIRDPDPHSESTPKNWTRYAKLRKLRTGVLYEVRKDASHLSRRRLIADLKMARFHIEPPNMSALTDEVLEFQRTTSSPHHNGMVKLAEIALTSELTCWRCGSRTRVGRERLAMAVEHVKVHGGKILLSEGEINVHQSSLNFDWRPHQRSRRRTRTSDSS
jgi:hypothetical protein